MIIRLENLKFFYPNYLIKLNLLSKYNSFVNLIWVDFNIKFYVINNKIKFNYKILIKKFKLLTQ